MQQQQTYNLTEGKVSTLILRFFFPVFFSNMLQQLYNVADTVIVGKGLGDNALAAVGNMSSLTYFVMGRPFVPMLSGMLEMIIRVMVIILFVSEIGFVATAWANTVAWFGALALNFVAFEVNLRRKMRG